MRTQRGFAVGAILLAIVLMAVVAGAMVLANRGPTSNSADHSAKVNASTILQQGSNLRIGFDVMQARGFSPGTITFDNGANGLFNPTTGGAQPQTVPSVAQSTPATWQYKQVQIKSIGTDAGIDFAMIVPNIKDVVCAQIMQALYNTSSLPVSGSSAAAWTNGTVLDLSGGIAGIDGRSEACVTTTDGADMNVYYTVTSSQ